MLEVPRKWNVKAWAFRGSVRNLNLYRREVQGLEIITDHLHIQIISPRPQVLEDKFNTHYYKIQVLDCDWEFPNNIFFLQNPLFPKSAAATFQNCMYSWIQGNKIMGSKEKVVIM